MGNQSAIYGAMLVQKVKDTIMAQLSAGYEVSNASITKKIAPQYLRANENSLRKRIARITTALAEDGQITRIEARTQTNQIKFIITEIK